MITLLQAQEMLKDRSLSKVSKATGLKYFVVRRIAIGQHESIKATDLQILSKYLTGATNEATA